MVSSPLPQLPGVPGITPAPANNALGALAQPQTPAPQPPANEQEKQSLIAQWETALADPKTQAALLQFATSVLQPLPPGQTQGGHLANAFAGAGQAAGRFTATQTAEEQRGIENKRASRKLDQADEENVIRREGVEVQREGVAQRETQATLEAEQKKLDREARQEDLSSRIEAELGIVKAQQNGALLGALLDLEEQILSDFDPLSLPPGVDVAAAQAALAEEARSRTLSRFLRLQQMRTLDPETLPIETMAEALALDEEESLALLRLMGVPEDRLQEALELARASSAEPGAGVPRVAPIPTPGRQGSSAKAAPAAAPLPTKSSGPQGTGGRGKAKLPTEVPPRLPNILKKAPLSPPSTGRRPKRGQ